MASGSAGKITLMVSYVPEENNDFEVTLESPLVNVLRRLAGLTLPCTHRNIQFGYRNDCWPGLQFR